jgi:hypothetical protein
MRLQRHHDTLIVVVQVGVDVDDHGPGMQNKGSFPKAVHGHQQDRINAGLQAPNQRLSGGAINRPKRLHQVPFQRGVGLDLRCSESSIHRVSITSEPSRNPKAKMHSSG